METPEPPDTEIFYPMPSDSETVVVSFGAKGGGRGVFHFFKLLRPLPGFSKLLVRDPAGHWYNAGLPGVGDTVEEIARRIEWEVGQLGGKRIITLGHSMGGYAAILFGCMLGAERAVALAPQTLLDPRLPLTPPAEVELQVPDLRPIVRDAPETAVDLIAGWDDPQDIFHAQRIAGLPSVRVLALRGEMHGFVTDLHEEGLLVPLIADVIAGGTPEICTVNPKLDRDTEERFADTVFAAEAGDWAAVVERIAPVAERHPDWIGPNLALEQALANIEDAKLAAQRGSAVCVLGMSRSGTSLTTRILNVLGVDLGAEEELMEPIADDNPAGFWEHEEIKDLNEDILATLGDAPLHAAWRWPPPLPQGWERKILLDPHRHTAKEILKRSFTGPALWGWKDPRNCLTLPFWQRLVPDMRYVICVRHPIDVANSLQARNDMPHEESLRLWLRYMSQAVIHTSGHPRVFVSYESYFPSWEAQTMRLAEFLGLSAVSDAQRAAIANHLDEGLWHHREAKQGTNAGAREVTLLPEADDLYTLLTALCDPGAAPGTEAELDATAQRVAKLVA